ncbi:MAG: LamG domain-containing protein [Bacteroidetes bacterium]|nr:LamG domain-containing protein [Bacteroidota bacterium]
MKYCLFILWVCTAGGVHAQGSSQALRFNGTNNYVRMSANNMGITHTVCIEAWVRTNQPNYRWICGKYNASADRGYHLYMSTNGVFGLAGRDGSGSYKSVGTPVGVNYADNQWHHVAGIWANNQMFIYVDGVLAASGSTGYTSTNLANSANLEIGRYWFDSQYWMNEIDEVRIWSRALTPEEIRRNMCQRLTGTETGLVAYYRMDEAAGNTCSPSGDVCDVSGNGNHGTLH